MTDTSADRQARLANALKTGAAARAVNRGTSHLGPELAFVETELVKRGSSIAAILGIVAKSHLGITLPTYDPDKLAADAVEQKAN